MLAFMVFLGCNTPSSKSDNEKLQSNDELFDEVMKIHDEAMVRMGELNQTKRGLAEHRVNVDSADVLFAEISSTIEFLESADEAMFDWMAKFKDPRGQLDEVNARSALMEEYQKVKIVDSLIDVSITKGKELLVKIQ